MMTTGNTMKAGNALAMDGDTWEWLKGSVGAGVTLGTGGGLIVTALFFLRWLATSLWGRQDVSHAKLMELLNERDAEVASFRERESAWHERDMQQAKRIAELEGIDMGIGALRANEQLIRALEAKINKLIGDKS